MLQGEEGGVLQTGPVVPSPGFGHGTHRRSARAAGLSGPSDLTLGFTGGGTQAISKQGADQLVQGHVAHGPVQTFLLWGEAAQLEVWS